MDYELYSTIRKWKEDEIFVLESQTCPLRLAKGPPSRMIRIILESRVQLIQGGPALLELPIVSGPFEISGPRPGAMSEFD